MKSIKTLLFVLVFSMTLLAGCGKKVDEAPVVVAPIDDASVATAVRVVDKIVDVDDSE